jgi:altronate dehydratase large subunit
MSIYIMLKATLNIASIKGGKMHFYGYPRKNSRSGIRNKVAVLPTIGCINELASEIASKVTGAIPFLHNHACIRLGPDLERAKRTLAGIGTNPNIHSVLLVGIGCESIPADELVEEILPYKRVEAVTIEKDGNYNSAMERGTAILRELVASASEDERVKCDIADLTIGIKCGGSGTVSAIASNPATGLASDLLIKNGGRVIFSETAEIIGAEHVLAGRASSKEVSEKLLSCVSRMKKEIADYGVDILGSEPTKGNIAGGLTTIEEKSLGAIIKGGSSPLAGVLEYGEKPLSSGLYFMDGTTQASQLFLGMFAAGAQIQVFSFGGGLPARFRGLPSYPPGIPAFPVIKIMGNPEDIEEIEYFDIYAGDIIRGKASVKEVGELIFNEFIKVASGKMTLTESRSGYHELLQIYANGLLM